MKRYEIRVKFCVKRRSIYRSDPFSQRFRAQKPAKCSRNTALSSLALSCVIAYFIIRVVNELSRNLSKVDEKYKVALTEDPFEYDEQNDRPCRRSAGSLRTKAKRSSLSTRDSLRDFPIQGLVAKLIIT